MKALLTNLAIALLWMFLRGPSLASFAVGFAVGFALLALFRTVLGGEAYVRRTLGFLRFLVVFGREFLLANLNVARAALFRRRESIHPAFILYDVAGLTRYEILLLSYCITLTPGTTTVELADDFRTLILHALDSDDPDQVRRHIDSTLKAAVLRFTR